jgi:hypothetical protein
LVFFGAGSKRELLIREEREERERERRERERERGRARERSVTGCRSITLRK